MSKFYLNHPQRKYFVLVNQEDEVLRGLVEQEAKKAGYKQVYLETHHNLPIAILLYKKLGYTQIPQALPGTVHSTMDHFFVKDL